MNFLLPKEDLDQLFRYLVNRPWAEANGLIQRLQQLSLVPEPPPAPQAPVQTPSTKEVVPNAEAQAPQNQPV